MIRLVAIQIGLFLAPFLVFALARALRTGRTETAPLPIFRLTLAGLALMAAAFLVLAAFEGGSATGTYVPDHFENGRLVPGGIR